MKTLFGVIYIANIILPIILCFVSMIPLLQTSAGHYESQGQSIFVEKKTYLLRFFLGLAWAILTLSLTPLIAPYIE